MLRRRTSEKGKKAVDAALRHDIALAKSATKNARKHEHAAERRIRDDEIGRLRERVHRSEELERTARKAASERDAALREAETERDIGAQELD